MRYSETHVERSPVPAERAQRPDMHHREEHEPQPQSQSPQAALPGRLEHAEASARVQAEDCPALHDEGELGNGAGEEEAKPPARRRIAQRRVRGRGRSLRGAAKAQGDRDKPLAPRFPFFRLTVWICIAASP